MADLKLIKATDLKQIPDPDTLVFGHYFSDHMFVMDYQTGKGWYDPRIVPYGEFSIYPSAMVLHYGQAIFEGMKAFYNDEGDIVVFRPRDYLERFNRSAGIMCIPQMDVDLLHDSLKQLIDLEKRWVPRKEGTSLYIRPFVISTDPYVGVKVADQYKLFIILSPVGAYYAEGFNPVSIKVEDKYVRAVQGGLGEAKTPANYAASLRAHRGRVKALLLNQAFIAGLGNIYVDEALFRAGVHPLAQASRVSRPRALGLHAAIVEVLSEAIAAGGSSISDYADAQGRQGGFQRFHRVYGREGEPCPACGTPIRRIVVGQRGTHFCPRCQRR